MRFIVDAYRYLILVFLGLGLVALAFTVATLAMSSTPNVGLTGWAIAGAVAACISVILALGVTATFISMHDRLADIAATLGQIATKQTFNTRADQAGDHEQSRC